MRADDGRMPREPLHYPAALLQLSSEMLATVDSEGRLETVNLVWEYVLGIPFEELRSALFCDLFHPDDREKIVSALRELSLGKVVAPMKVRGRRRDGADVRILLRLAALADHRVCLVAGRDISPSEAIGQGQSDGLSLPEFGLLAAVLAHDFNNVLSFMRGGIGALRTEPGLAPPHLQELDDLDGAVRHGAALVQQIFDYGCRESRQDGDADLNKVIARMGWLLRRLGQKSIAVDLVLACGLGRAKVAEVQVEQIILNLAFNARDAMPAGGRLVIETSDSAGAGARPAIQPPIPPGDYVRLAVVDSGRGIPAETRARIFEPGFTTKSSGAGLGLASVRRIVRQCGGHIRLRSTPGEGTTFEVYFPRSGAPLPDLPS